MQVLQGLYTGCFVSQLRKQSEHLATVIETLLIFYLTSLSSNIILQRLLCSFVCFLQALQLNIWSHLFKEPRLA